jgi:hypothetical protein
MDLRSSSLTRRTGEAAKWMRHTTTLVGRAAGPASGTSAGELKIWFGALLGTGRRGQV